MICVCIAQRNKSSHLNMTTMIGPNNGVRIYDIALVVDVISLKRKGSSIRSNPVRRGGESNVSAKTNCTACSKCFATILKAGITPCFDRYVVSIA